MSESQLCTACHGAGGTEKVTHTVELDAEGDQVHRQDRHWSACSLCHGATVIQ
ncbi:hypothetical protein AB0D08_21930 [Kitasatospora sp. NPDC048540]|uniref:hypothetical protein n=1 Tax=unclassified Kitasatospora TaxID=2633591 RepID=UPI000B0D73CD|nr:hypothetical protein [Kitasatospora sp. MBT63]